MKVTSKRMLCTVQRDASVTLAHTCQGNFTHPIAFPDGGTLCTSDHECTWTQAILRLWEKSYVVCEKCRTWD